VPSRVRIPSPSLTFSNFSSTNQGFLPKHAHVFSIDDGFLKWIQYQKYTPNHVAHLKSYFNRHFRRRCFLNHIELDQYIKQQKLSVHTIINTARVCLRYCEQLELMPEDVIKKYRSVLKIVKSNNDFFVPSDDVVLTNYLKVKSVPNYSIVYLVLATAGIRYTECLTFLKSYDKDKFIVQGNHVAYHVSHLRHTKNINNIHLPLFVFNKLIHVTNSYDSLRQKFKRKGCTFSLKYLRKWHYNLMLYNNMPESVADFIQGRSNRSISANHYLAKSQQASFWYEKLVPVLREVFL